MMHAAKLMPSDSDSPSRFQSAMFQAPGRPRPLARRLAIHNRAVERIRKFFFDNGFHEIPVTALADFPAKVQLDGMLDRGFKAVWCESEIMPRNGKLEPRHMRGFKLFEAACKDIDLTELGARMEAVLKHVAGGMTANLLGGRDVTRLDRMLHLPHPRLTHAEAMELLDDRGWNQTDSHSLPGQALESLVRHCGNLPFLVTDLPVELSDDPDLAGNPLKGRVTGSCLYVLPFAGVSMAGTIRTTEPTRAEFSLDLGPLLQYLMGLANLEDTLIDPMERVAIRMKAARLEGDACDGASA